MTEFTPVASLVGGLMIGAAAVLLLALQGQIAGVSGIAVRSLPPYRDGAVPGRLGFVAGLVLAPLVTMLVTGHAVTQTVSANLPLMAAAGLLAGFGAVWGSGCTSGHGVCGLSRLSPRSLVATLTFMATGFVTVYLLRHVFGG